MYLFICLQEFNYILNMFLLTFFVVRPLILKSIFYCSAINFMLMTIISHTKRTKLGFHSQWKSFLIYLFSKVNRSFHICSYFLRLLKIKVCFCNSIKEYFWLLFGEFGSLIVNKDMSILFYHFNQNTYSFN